MKPVGGYPSLKAGVKALLAEGLGREDIAVTLKVSGDAVRRTITDLRSQGLVVPHGTGGRRKGDENSPEHRRRISEGLRQRADRDAQAASPSSGLRPPSPPLAVGVRQSATQVGEGMEPRASQGTGRHVASKAELDAIRPVVLSGAGASRRSTETQARTRTRFHLKGPGGRFLHLSGEGLTPHRIWAWIGFQHQLEALLRQRPELQDFEIVPVAPVTGGLIRGGMMA